MFSNLCRVKEHLKRNKKNANLWNFFRGSFDYYIKLEVRILQTRKSLHTEHILKLCRRQGMTKSNNPQILCLLLYDISLF